MIRALLPPKTPAEEWAAERARVAKRQPHLSIVPKPEPDHFVWRSVKDLIPVESEG